MKRYYVLLVLGAWIFTHLGYAQQVIPVVDKMLRDSIGENATRNTKQAGYLTAVRRMTKNTKEDVAATEQLQSDYRKFLRQTGSTASLALLDNEDEQEAAGQAANASQYLDAYSFAKNLGEAYAAQTVPMNKSQALYERLIPFDESLVFTDLTAWDAYQKSRQLNVAALEEMSQRRKLQLAQTYRQFAQQKIVKADELRVLLTTDQQFSMTETERLTTIGRMQDYLLSSQQLNAKADELIRQVSNPSFQKKEVTKAFQQQQERQVLGTTPLFKD